MKFKLDDHNVSDIRLLLQALGYYQDCLEENGDETRNEFALNHSFFVISHLEYIERSIIKGKKVIIEIKDNKISLDDMR